MERDKQKTKVLDPIMNDDGFHVLWGSEYYLELIAEERTQLRMEALIIVAWVISALGAFGEGWVRIWMHLWSAFSYVTHRRPAGSLS